MGFVWGWVVKLWAGGKRRANSGQRGMKDGKKNKKWILIPQRDINFPNILRLLCSSSGKGKYWVLLLLVVLTCISFCVKVPGWLLCLLFVRKGLWRFHEYGRYHDGQKGMSDLELVVFKSSVIPLSFKLSIYWLKEKRTVPEENNNNNMWSSCFVLLSSVRRGRFGCECGRYE